MSSCCSGRGTRHERAPDRPRDAGGAGRPRRLRHGRMPAFQGWVEAELIFVGPDETGRIETLTVREGDQVELRQLLFTLDAELQPPTSPCGRPQVKNAQQAYDRAAALAEEHVRHAKGAGRCRGRAAHRAGEAQLGADQADAPQGVQPGRRQRPADLLPRRRTGAGRQADRRHPASGQPESALLRQRSDAAQAQARRPRLHPVATAAPPISPPRSASSPARRNSRRR